nr:hypothetical protein [uncultured Mucilaginibacter sp.]
MRLFFLLTFIILTFLFKTSYSQQDMDLHISGTFLSGKNILKVNRDVFDPYLWVLAQNNEVYRINSITRDIDDYTATFNTYNNLQFIDIAGVSKDTVFIATKSVNTIQYKNGGVKLISAINGIKGSVTGVGVNNAYNNSDNYFLNPLYQIFITTDKGIFKYDYKTEIVTPADVESDSRLFEKSYRDLIFHGTNFCRCYNNDPNFISYDITKLLGHTVYGGEVFTGNVHGNLVKSAYISVGNPYDVSQQFSLFANNFWATEKGLFQNYWSYSSDPHRPYETYLNGVDINKITSIMGLRKFSHESDLLSDLVKENLLVGAADGLYFSNSQYHKGVNAKYSFSHFDALGNISVNDIAVNADTYKFSRSRLIFSHGEVCEDGIWIATSNGLYFLVQDYKPYIDPNFKLQAINVDGRQFSLDDVDLCENESVTARIQYVQYNALAFLWYKNGQLINGENLNSLNINSAGDYYAKIIDPCSNVTIETRRLKVNVITTPVLTFNYPDKINQCQGTSATLQVNANSKYSYRWYKNGVLNGNSTAVSNTTESGKYKVEASSCSGTSVSTKEVEVNFISVPQPTLSANKTAYCIGEIATLSTGFINDGSYTLNWFRDGNVLNGEQNKTSITTTQGGIYTIKLSSNSAACDNTSSALTLNFISVPKPGISANKLIYCVGESAVLTTNFINDGTYTINWLFNGTVLSAEKDKTSISATQAGNYAVKLSSKLSACDNTSASYALNFESIPTLKLEKIITTTLCDGQKIEIKATYSGGAIKWTTGEIGDKISVNSSGKYSATITSAAGCTVTEDIDVQFVANPTLQLADATVCELRNQSVTLKAPPGFVKYEWNGQSGSANFTTRVSGPVILKITDNNGCTATQTINITSECHDIYTQHFYAKQRRL